MTEIVKANINKEIQIELLREEKENEANVKDLLDYQNKKYQLIKLVIVPKIWKGQGVLG